MNIKMNKLIISNSQGSWLDTDGIPYTKLIADKNTFCYVRSGIDIIDVMNNFDEIFKTNTIDIVIIQLGIVEISNRILQDKTKRLLSKLLFLGNIITKMIWTHKYKWMKLKKRIGLKDYQKMNSKQLKNVYLELCEKLILINVKKIYIIGLPKLNLNYIKTQNPYINKFIEEANFELENLQNKKIIYIDIQELLCNDENNFTKNTVHFTKIGHEKLAYYLKNNIKELNNNDIYIIK